MAMTLATKITKITPPKDVLRSALERLFPAEVLRDLARMEYEEAMRR